MDTSQRDLSKPSFLRRVAIRLGTIGMLVKTVWKGPFWYLVPFVCVLVVFAVFLVLVSAFPAAAPFFYAMF